ncbi:Type 4 prepilin-like proteins leader peptide-processing enzyme (Protein secretion protein XCPA) (Protein pilD) (Includes: Leader peptidase (Prepilin peptidase); N-methyltransferase) [Thiocapsa sp. KS1]|nr:A24 family peptidase [Thiocapsa sp. KS1]CRI65694.1 Type 4 prepilin-like proteins leader peptide-processing enzyme (Protein secretion protein XCPA) (Protein pilD) (Includes: Leader peptidase (Prepilin peptidase); N-methyltransferase) [Thiocapsa sp. KS1]
MDWIDVFEQTPLLLYAVSILVGLIVGSFLNVVILRLPKMLEDTWARDCAELSGGPSPSDQTDQKPLSLAHPPSTCSHCGHRIRAHENIPVLSYLLLRGRCSACGAGIGLRYPLVEIFTALLTLIVVLQLGLGWQTGPALLLTWALIALAVIDFDTQLLPDSITLPLLWLGLVLSLFTVFADSHSAIIGAVAGYLSLWSVFHLFRLATGKEGMGYGDFKLLALFGAWLGWQSLPQIILLSALTGAVLGVALILSGRHARGTPMPFGPFLAAAGWISLIWGEQINQSYLRLVGL